MELLFTASLNVRSGMSALQGELMVPIAPNNGPRRRFGWRGLNQSSGITPRDIGNTTIDRPRGSFCPMRRPVVQGIWWLAAVIGLGPCGYNSSPAMTILATGQNFILIAL